MYLKNLFLLQNHYCYSLEEKYANILKVYKIGTSTYCLGYIESCKDHCSCYINRENLDNLQITTFLEPIRELRLQSKHLRKDRCFQRKRGIKH